uniref:Uncharacterized protein n=1 Tax=Octopus bimaculoides TaxID=37653 RepID=A0A0L8HAI5_OCTBM
MYYTALTHPGHNVLRHQDGFNKNDEENQNLLDEVHEAYRASQQARTSDSKRAFYNSIKRWVHVKLREMMDSWLSNMADEIHKCAQNNNSKIYNALKTIYELQSYRISSLLITNGTTLLIDKHATLKIPLSTLKPLFTCPS